jgi:hypothetical protein
METCMKIKIILSSFIILIIFLISGCGTTYNFGTEISATITTSDSKNNSTNYYNKFYYFNPILNSTYKITLNSSNTSIGVSVFDDNAELYPTNVQIKDTPVTITYKPTIISKSVFADVWITSSALASAGNSVSFTIKIEKQ